MSQREIKLRVPAGASIPVRAAGDFIFVKFCERDVIVRINGQAITMKAGDKQRLERTQGDLQKPAFTEFDLDNSASALPLAVIFVVGVGDYSGMIVSGEITAASGVRKADGTWADDTRRQLPVTFQIDPTYAAEIYAYQQLNTFNKLSSVAHCAMTVNQRGNLVFANANTLDGTFKQTFDEFTVDGAYVGSFKLQSISGSTFTEIAYDHTAPVAGYYFGVVSSGAVYRMNATSAVQVIPADAAWGLDSGMCVDKSTRELVMCAYRFSDTHRYIRRFAVDGLGNVTFSAQFDLQVLTGISHRAVWAENGAIYVSDPSGATPAQRYIYKIDPSGTGRILGQTSGWPWISSASYRRLCRVGNFWVGIGDSSGLVVSKVSTKAFTLSARGYARYGRSGADTVRIFKLDYAAAFKTSAVMAATDTTSGRLLTGQIIRAALELYYGEIVADNYLDSVYGVIIYSDAEQSDLPPMQEVKTSGKSFAAAKIADNFSAYIPGWVEITVDNSLTFV